MSDTITERIKKLLRLGADKRGNAHEAERAMQLAFELAEKHRVDIESLDLDERTARIMHEWFELGRRLDRLRRGIIAILQTYFHVSTCVVASQLMVAGREQDIIIARYVYDFLLRAGRDCLRTYAAAERAARRKMTTAKRAGYISGFIYGLAHSLNKSRSRLSLTDAQEALVIAEGRERDRYLDQFVPGRKNLKALTERRHRRAIDAGFADGRSTSIRQPLNPSDSPSLLLLK